MEFDSDVFEELAQRHFEPLNSWESVYYNPANRQFVLFRRTGSLDGGEVLKIRLTAKEDLQAKDAYVGVGIRRNGRYFSG